MTLRGLYDEIVAEPPPPYDSRLSVAMTATQYEAYERNIGHTYYLLLSKLVRRLKPKKILELGTSIGRSALFMMTVLPPTSELVTVDIGSYLRSELFGFSDDKRLKIVFGNDLDQSVIAQVGDSIDMLYIDSEHEVSHLEKEWGIYKELLVDGALVVMDDIGLNEGLRAFWDALPYEKIDTGIDTHFSGFGLFIYTKA